MDVKSEAKEFLKLFVEKLGDFENLPDSEKVKLIEDGFNIAKKSNTVSSAIAPPKKRTMRDIIREQMGYVRTESVDVPLPIRGISSNDLAIIDRMITSGEASQDAYFKAAGTVFSLLVTAAMFA